MSKKLIVFIGEGKSEYSFFKTFIENEKSICKYIENKSEILLESDTAYILFAHPRIGTSYCGGDSELEKPQTYIQVRNKIKGSKYFTELCSKTEITYILFTDTDQNPKRKLHKASELIKEYCKEFEGNIIYFLPSVMIETWFISGIGEKFLKKYPSTDSKRLKKFLQAKNIEKVQQTKNILLNEILIKTNLGGEGQQYIVGREFGELIDIELASKRCNSFNDFLSKIKALLS